MGTHTYDEFPYRCVIRPDIQPNQLATLATLFNLQPPAVPTSRILELGCGNGINLIAIAQSFPQTHCVGIDYSAQQIADGQHLIEEIGLSNITLQHLDILAVTTQLGNFDYIISHGVYSWVPEPVREKILRICTQQLSPSGIAYISYNTYPGWYFSQMQREMFLYFHAQQFQDTLNIRPAETKQLLSLALALNQTQPGAFTSLLQEHWERFAKPDLENYLRHDLLESTNQPFYFYQFIQKLRQYNLEYITDVHFRDGGFSHHPLLNSPAITQQLFKNDFLAQEQYLDFFGNRKLRMSLFGHQGLTVKRELDPKLLPKFYVAMNSGWSAVTTSQQEVTQSLTLQKIARQPVTITTPWTQLAIGHLLQKHPRNLAFNELLQSVLRNHFQLTSRDNESELTATLAVELLELYVQEVIELSVLPTPGFSTTINDYPMVSPLARWQAAQGQTTIVNVLGQLGQLDEFTCQLLPYLDGNHSRLQLLDLMAEWVVNHNLTVMVGAEEVAFSQLPTTEVVQILEWYLNDLLTTIAKHALLVDS